MSEPRVFRTLESFQEALAETAAARLGVTDTPLARPVIGFVPTMGALHAGHGALLDAARGDSDVVVASVFVNPLQFDDDADYRAYPRQLEADVALLAAHGVDLVLAPELEDMYPGGDDPQVSVTAGSMGRLWEGASRPGHFDGVSTVVAKLFSLLLGAVPTPEVELQAWFGEKDAEQLAIIRRLVVDLNLSVQIRALPIVREPSGLAMSSRNQRLSPTEREQAAALAGALTSLRDRAAAGRPLALDDVVAGLNAAEGVDLDYLVVVDPETLLEAQPGGPLLSADQVLASRALALVAARVGPVRLIDNMWLDPAG